MVLIMKKLLTLILTFCFVISANASMIQDIAKHADLSSEEAFFNDFNEKFDASQKQIAKLLKKDDEVLEENFGPLVEKLKSEQEEYLFSLALDHNSTTREIVETLSSEETQELMNLQLKEKMAHAGGFEVFKQKLESSDKGLFREVGKFFRSVFRFVGGVIAFVFLYPLMYILVLTGVWG